MLSEWDRDEFGGRGEGGHGQGSPLPEGDTATHWTTEQLQQLPLQQRRWKAKVVSDRLLCYPGCSWRDPFLSSSTQISEEGPL